jgi:hypothetical protein
MGKEKENENKGKGKAVEVKGLLVCGGCSVSVLLHAAMVNN